MSITYALHEILASASRTAEGSIVYENPRAWEWFGDALPNPQSRYTHYWCYCALQRITAHLDAHGTLESYEVRADADALTGDNIAELIQWLYESPGNIEYLNGLRKESFCPEDEDGIELLFMAQNDAIKEVFDAVIQVVQQFEVATKQPESTGSQTME